MLIHRMQWLQWFGAKEIGTNSWEMIMIGCMGLEYLPTNMISEFRYFISLRILAHLLRMVMEPKYLAKEVIIHPNHPLSSFDKVIGSLGYVQKSSGFRDLHAFFHYPGSPADQTKWLVLQDDPWIKDPLQRYKVFLGRTSLRSNPSGFV